MHTILTSGAGFRLLHPYSMRSFLRIVKEIFKQPGGQAQVKMDIKQYASKAQNTHNSGVNDRSQVRCLINHSSNDVVVSQWHNCGKERKNVESISSSG